MPTAPGRSDRLLAAWRRRARFILSLAGIGLVLIVFMVVGPRIPDSFGFDSRAYWGHPRDDLYPMSGTVNGYGIYRYSPAFVPLMALFTLLPWPVFAAAFAAASFGVYRWLAGRDWLPLLVFPPIVYELYMGNIHLLLAAAIVLGFRYPAAWAFVLLTKVTPGIGLLWFLVRREWRSLGIALGATVGVAAAGWLLAPDLWRDWVTSLFVLSPSVGENVWAIPLTVRLGVAALLVTWGALTNRFWTVPAAAMLGLPTLWEHGWSMLIGAYALRRGLGVPALARPNAVAGQAVATRTAAGPLRRYGRAPISV